MHRPAVPHPSTKIDIAQGRGIGLLHVGGWVTQNTHIVPRAPLLWGYVDATTIAINGLVVELLLVDRGRRLHALRKSLPGRFLRPPAVHWPVRGCCWGSSSGAAAGVRSLCVLRSSPGFPPSVDSGGGASCSDLRSLELKNGHQNY
eukprot:SAG31_NODE_18412_length_637_cov_1.249071_1_plen_145_part_10